MKTKMRMSGVILLGALMGCVAQQASGQSIRRAKVSITAGPTVQVSKAEPNVMHYEILAASDPVHPGRLITCSQAQAREPDRDRDTNCYVTFDGGKTWDLTLQVTEATTQADPTVVYGLGDDVYVVVLVIPVIPGTSWGFSAHTVVYKSTDGGRTWKEASRFEFTDRPYIGIDRNGKYPGRLYVAGHLAIPGITSSVGTRYAVQLWRSLDGGSTFLGPVQALYPEGASILGFGTGAVLQDGTFAIWFGLGKPGRARGGRDNEYQPFLGPNMEAYVVSTSDGGETFSEASKIGDFTVALSRTPGAWPQGQMAVDPGSEAFKDRLYAVFPASSASGDSRGQVQFIYSTDKGKTWSQPVIVNDDRTPGPGEPASDHLLPVVAVNEDGVVLVTWNDTREARDGLGWIVRGAASLDGGETFSASVALTDVAHDISSPTTEWPIIVRGGQGMSAVLSRHLIGGGDTGGLAADLDGTFHPVWSDSRTGVMQLWTTSVKVDGTAVRNGAPDLAGLDDISRSLSLELSRQSFDRATGTLSLTAQLRNTSKDTVVAPVKVRVLRLESQLGIPEILNTDNGENGTGAVWDFSPQLSGAVLAPGGVSSPRTLTFRITDIRPVEPGRRFRSGLVSLDTRVLGRSP